MDEVTKVVHFYNLVFSITPRILDKVRSALSSVNIMEAFN